MTDRALLADYARAELRGEGVYRGYRPRLETLAQLAATLPTAHVVVISAPWCGDCRREVPKLARIMEQLPPAWTVELAADDNAIRDRYTVLAIPTFLVLDAPGGRELGRMIESPTSADGIEGDLLAIGQAARASVSP